MANLSPNDQLLESIRSRKSKSEPFNGGILTADSYVSTLQECVGIEACYKFAVKGSTSFDDALKKAAKTLTYNNSDMVLQENYGNNFEILKDHKGESIEVPKNTLMLFRHILTTPKKDRDGDILRTDGATIDPNMLLLWQHVHTLPIGKALGIAEHSAAVLSMFSAIVDMNELSQDAAVMIDNEMGRFSHGFSAEAFKQLESTEDDPFPGFDVTRFSIMEESLVSIPSNTDAEVQEVILSLVESGKLTSSLMKEVGISIREKRPVSSSVKYKEKIGNYEHSIETSNAADFETVFNKVNNDENKSRSGSPETKGSGKGCPCNTPKETNGSEKEEKVSKNEEVKSFMGRTGTERGHDHAVFLDDEGDGETSVKDGHSHQIHNWEVGSEGDHIHTLDRGSLSKVDFDELPSKFGIYGPNGSIVKVSEEFDTYVKSLFSGKSVARKAMDELDAKQAMAIFLVKSTSEQKQHMINALKAFEDAEKRTVLTEEFRSLVGS